MFNKLILTLVLLFSVSGCSTLGNLVSKGAEVNDDALKASEFTICKAASVGSVLRRYNTKELSEAWVKLCLNSNSNPIVTEVKNNE